MQFIKQMLKLLVSCSLSFFLFFSICISLVRIIHSMGQGQSKKFALQRVKDQWCPHTVLHEELALLCNSFMIYHVKSICFEKKGVKRFYSIGCNGELL